MALLSLLDPLYCQEDNLELEEEPLGAMLPPADDLEVDCHLLSSSAVGEEWEAVLSSLLAKELETGAVLGPETAAGFGEDAYLRSARREAAEWVARVAARHAFSALTALLAMNYLDRCFLSSSGGGLRLQEDKPWMGRLAAVACLSLAAKVEETRVPLLLDLQVSTTDPAEEGGYVFEPKTIRRMELLVLSVLGWRMNPVTPLTFVHHILPRLCSNDDDDNDIAGRIRELVRACEMALLSVIADRRWVQYPASAWAAAALLHATEAFAQGGGIIGGFGYDGIHCLIALLNAPKANVEQCYHLILEALVGSDSVDGGKRKRYSSYDQYHCAPSPKGVIGSCFSCESSTSSSSDYWLLWPSSVTSSPEARPLKKLNGYGGRKLWKKAEGNGGYREMGLHRTYLFFSYVSIKFYRR